MLGYLKTGLIGVVLLLSLTICGCEFFGEQYEDDHSIDLYFPNAAILEKPDTLDVYGDGKLIASVSTDGKAVERIDYDIMKSDEKITVYSHLLKQTYECRTIDERMDEIEETVHEAGDTMSLSEENKLRATMKQIVRIDYETNTMDDYETMHEYEDWLAGVCTVKFVIRNIELVEPEQLRFTGLYIYKDETYFSKISYVENVSNIDVVPRNSEKYSCVIKWEESKEYVLDVDVEIVGKESVEIVIDFAELLE